MQQSSFKEACRPLGNARSRSRWPVGVPLNRDRAGRLAVDHQDAGDTAELAARRACWERERMR
jgi:hypothetical protein